MASLLRTFHRLTALAHYGLTVADPWHYSENEISDLHRLGWNDFQHLCLTITREILGQTVESFLDSGDGGRDGAFTGTWNPNGQEDLSGPFVIQCKFTSKISYVPKPSNLSDEVEKAKRLVAKGLCESQVLMTNAGLSGIGAGRIKALFRDIFKNAYLPYRDPETLKAFLKIMNEFSYDHSERLGDAFEYLLSLLGSQGDAGQFRTPCQDRGGERSWGGAQE